jgi:transcription antitermination factor NusA-like protein
MATINMQTMRYINMLDRVSRVKTTKCFNYNGAIVFAVSKHFVSQAIGPNANNIKVIQDNLGKRVKIIKEPQGVDGAKEFIEEIVSPVKFKSLEVKDSELIVTAGNMQNKASLLGRNKKRYEELSLIIKDTFSLDLKII